ncbi:NrsF family protein [Hyphomicrobium sp. NDB2Meth4]|uniref:NrsF family protein n=1 Tax=Hyphomicrobium sp. NDB2Meth4 TaxID=1892846 RepID=UPI000930A82C|nr:NrsF family protein [Hyphomicrobium sp. NDB2Meth4]
MKTNQLINAIAADAKAPSIPISTTVLFAAGIGIIATGLLFWTMLPVRGDMGAAMGDWRFLMKWAFSLSLLLTGIAMAISLARPQWSPSSKLLLLLTGPAILAIGVVAELISLPASDWMPTMVGTAPIACLVYVPLLSGLPLALMIVALRRGAPARPAAAGAVAGVIAVGIAATFYATHCQNDSPLFLAAWYIISTVIVASIGAILGARLLRW